MATLRFSIDTINHTILLTNIKMNQSGFSYNSITFTKIDDNTVNVDYKKQTPENDQEGINYNLSWALNDIMKVLSEYNKAGHNPYNKNYKMFEFEF